MNVYAVIILGALLAEYVLGGVAAALNVRAAALSVPDEFAGVFSPERYRQSQQYLRANTRVGLATATANLILIVVFWFSGGFEVLDQLLRGWVAGPVLRGVLFIGILGIGHALLLLPFSAYDTFVVERRFGFNRTTVGTFLLDRAKVLALAIGLGGALLAAILFFFEAAGPCAWLYCWGVSVAFLLVVQFVAPIWIMPLFNRFSPLEDGELRQTITAYAARMSFPVRSLWVIDGSRRSTHSNAFIAGFGRNKRVGLFDTLVAEHPARELLAVVAHEVGHWRRGHVIKATVLEIIHTGVVFFLLSLFLSSEGLFAAFGVTHLSVYAGLVFFSMLYAPVEMLLGPGLKLLSRRHEFQADRFAAETTGDADAMICALKKLAAHNLSNLTPHPLTVVLQYSHPPVLQRLRALRRGGA